jgi:hypothetical protein
MRPQGANPHPVIHASGALPGRVNYLLGRDRSQWHTNVPITRAVSYRGVYPGISGLTPNTTYRYRLVATNANGTTTGVVRSFTTGTGT